MCIRDRPRPEDWGLELVLGAVGTEAHGAHSGKSLSNPTVKPHLPGHTSGNANEAVPSGGGSASEGPSPFGLLQMCIRDSCWAWAALRWRVSFWLWSRIRRSSLAAARASASSALMGLPFLSRLGASKTSIGQGWSSTTGTFRPISFSISFNRGFSEKSHRATRCV